MNLYANTSDQFGNESKVMRVNYWLFVVLIAISPVLSAQLAVPGINPSITAAGAAKSHVVKPPDPRYLSAGWWRYFDADSADLTERINQFATLLNSLYANESDQVKAEVAAVIENLQRYAELRDKSLSVTLATSDIQSAYSLRQWLDMVRKRQALQAESQSESEDLKKDLERHNAAKRQLDTLMAAYLEQPDAAPPKSAEGLRVMSFWVELVLEGEKLRLKKAFMETSKAQLMQLNREVKAARSRIVVTDQDVAQLKKDIEAAEHSRLIVRENLTRLVAAVDVENLDSDDGNARALLSKQLINHATIKEALADTILLRKRMEYLLMRMLRTEDAGTLNEWQVELQDYLEQIYAIKDKLEVWQDKAESDQDRAGKSLASLFVSSGKQSSERVVLTQKRLTEVQNTLLSLQRLASEIDDAELIADRADALVVDKQGALIKGLVNVRTSTLEIWESVWERLGGSLFKIGETPVTLLGILRLILVIAFAWALSHFVRRGLTHLTTRQGDSSTYLYTLGRLAHYLILIIGISIGLSSIGVDLSNFALIAGALSVGVGFGLQAIVNNFVSGLIVLFERSLRIGDFVELSNGLAGEVKAINVRSTLVTTTDMVDILVPNSEFVNGQVINWTLTDASRRIHIPFGVAYGSDKDIVRKAALEAAHNTPHTLRNRINRDPEVWLINFGDSSLDFELVVWVQPQAVKKPQRVRAAYYWELETALRKYGVEIPFPQRDLHIRSGLQSVESQSGPALAPDNVPKPD